jgi:hypothetical protein
MGHELARAFDHSVQGDHNGFKRWEKKSFILSLYLSNTRCKISNYQSENTFAPQQQKLIKGVIDLDKRFNLVQQNLSGVKKKVPQLTQQIGQLEKSSEASSEKLKRWYEENF